MVNDLVNFNICTRWQATVTVNEFWGNRSNLILEMAAMNFIWAQLQSYEIIYIPVVVPSKYIWNGSNRLFLSGHNRQSKSQCTDK